MRTMLFVCLTAVCLVWAQAVPVVGAWEGQKDGRKAVTLEVREREGILGGRVVIYIVHDDGDGSKDGAALDPMPMKGTTWDGKVLRFEAGVARWEFKVTGADRGELTVIAPEHTEIQAMRRRR